MNFHVPTIERLHRAANPSPPLVDPFELGYVNPLAIPQPAEQTSSATAASPPQIQATPQNFDADLSEWVTQLIEYLDFPITDPIEDFEKGYVNPLDQSRPEPLALSGEQEQLEERRAALLNELRLWSAKAREFLTDHRDWHTGKLQRQYAEAWHAARTQKAIVDGIAAEHEQSAANIRKLKAVLSQTKLLFLNHTPPDRDALPSQADLDAWEAEHSVRRRNWEAADQAVTAEIDRQRQLALRHGREKLTYQRLKQTEHDLRIQIGGPETTVTGLASEL
jgi:hypothetical protein